MNRQTMNLNRMPINSILVSEHRFSDAINRPLSTAPLGAGLLALVLFAFVSALPTPAHAQEQPAPPPSQQATGSTKQDKQAAPDHQSIGGELAKETREAAGEDQEENANLKHAKPVQWLARKIDWSVHGTHLLLSALNFAIIAVVLFWAARKFLPGMFRNRTASIQQALEEARAASQDANRRLADIENRLRQLDVEIGQMQASAEKEGDAEEVRIQKAAEEDIRKVVLAAEREIAAAAKQARRELATHTASLAIALARQQINVDSNTDQVLVRSFASKLASRSSDDDGGGKDGR
ncbi:MAG: ATP synthase F0 subunit B [Terriglobales bacterium]